MNNKPSTALAFDIGLKRTGVAVGESMLGTATVAGLLEVKQGQFNWSELDRLIGKWLPDVIVIGNPNTLDPHLNKLINRFKSHIQKNHKLTIVDVDETLTSSAANHDLQQAELTLNKKTQLRDQIAACLILESYFRTLE